MPRTLYNSATALFFLSGWWVCRCYFIILYTLQILEMFLFVFVLDTWKNEVGQKESTQSLIFCASYDSLTCTGTDMAMSDWSFLPPSPSPWCDLIYRWVGSLGRGMGALCLGVRGKATQEVLLSCSLKEVEGFPASHHHLGGQVDFPSAEHVMCVLCQACTESFVYVSPVPSSQSQACFVPQPVGRALLVAGAQRAHCLSLLGPDV